MTDPNLLHSSHLDEFEGYLAYTGTTCRPGRRADVVLEVWGQGEWHPVYRRSHVRYYHTVVTPWLIRRVKAFYDARRRQTNG